MNGGAARGSRSAQRAGHKQVSGQGWWQGMHHKCPPTRQHLDRTERDAPAGAAPRQKLLLQAKGSPGCRAANHRRAGVCCCQGGGAGARHRPAPAPRQAGQPPPQRRHFFFCCWRSIRSRAAAATTARAALLLNVAAAPSKPAAVVMPAAQASVGRGVAGAAAQTPLSSARQEWAGAALLAPREGFLLPCCTVWSPQHPLHDALCSLHTH